MRYPIFALTTIAAIAALAPERAYAGDPEADKRVYDAFVKYMQTVPSDKKAQEYKKFLEWYPTNIYAPTVQKEYEVFLAGGKAPQNTNNPPQNTISTPPQTTENTGSGFGISTNKEARPAEVDPFEEAAGAVGGAEDAAAAALDGAVSVAEPTPIEAVPSIDVSTPVARLRAPKSYGFGADLALSAMVGPGVIIDYTTNTGLWTVGGAVRVPVFQAVSGALEFRRFLTPDKPLSAYLGGTFGGVAGDIDAILQLVSQDFPGSSATSATTFGALAGFQKMKPDGRAYYFELSYQALFSDAGEQGYFPGASVGYRYFRNSAKPAQPRSTYKYTW